MPSVPLPTLQLGRCVQRMLRTHGTHNTHSSARQHSQRRRAAAGFSLLELMICLVILGILAAVAYPSYARHVQSGRRAQAQANMMAAVQYMQRFYAAKGHYSAAELPPAYRSSEGYSIELSVSEDSQAFSLKATPTRPDALCGALTLADTGAKGQDGPGRVADCW